MAQAVLQPATLGRRGCGEWGGFGSVVGVPKDVMGAGAE
jgi:hypothetical protein